MSGRARGWLLVAFGAILLGAAMAGLEWPQAASGTPASPGWVTENPPVRAFFEAIEALGATDAEGEDAKVKVIAREPTDVYVVHNTVAPGADSGWHTHPGPSVVLVKVGTATVYMGNDPACTPHTYPAGTGFIDAGDTHVHLVRNEGATPLETYAFQLIPAGLSRRIDAPNPGYCPF